MNVCSACRVYKGECPDCGTFWWTRGDGKRYGMRPASGDDARRIRNLQQRNGTAGIVDWSELPNRIGPTKERKRRVTYFGKGGYEASR